jgi:hypothetical protein
MRSLVYSIPAGSAGDSASLALSKEDRWRFFPVSVRRLFILNVWLQVFDGLATYKGFQLGLYEGNPLINVVMEDWGVGGGLLLCKAAACALLVLLLYRGSHSIISKALALTSVCYLAFSFIPWSSLLVIYSIQ